MWKKACFFLLGGCHHLAFPSKSRLERCVGQLEPRNPESPSLKSDNQSQHRFSIPIYEAKAFSENHGSVSNWSLRPLGLKSEPDRRRKVMERGQNLSWNWARRFVFVRAARPDIPLSRTIPILNDFPNFPEIETPPTWIAPSLRSFS